MVLFPPQQKKVEFGQEKEYTNRMIKKLVNGLIFFGLILFFSGSGLSEESTPWQKGQHVESRLIADHKTVPTKSEGNLYLGWHVKLDTNWKTYWRTPGDAGLPPQIDWGGSINIAAADFMYPFPQRFQIFDLFTYGYHDEVVYPILITPVIEGAPITLKAHIRFLVCDDLCIPEEAIFELTIPASEYGAPLSLNAGLIDKYLAQVPKPGGLDTNPIQISSFETLGSDHRQNLIFTILGENLMSGAEIIVEDQDGIKFGLPEKRILQDSTKVEFIVPVSKTGEEEPMENQPVNVIVSDGWGNVREFALDLQN